VPAEPENDRAGVTPCGVPAARLTGDEPNDGLLHVLLDERRRVLLVGAADLAHHRDGDRVGIRLERGKTVD
jgi:hypothetical protein